MKKEKVENDKFYAIDYKTGLVVQITEKDLVKTYQVEVPKTNYYPTTGNKMAINKVIETSDRQRYYKLYKTPGEVITEIKVGDIVRDNEDFIYRIMYDVEDKEYYAKMIGDCVLFNEFDFYNYDEGDDDYDSEDG